MYILRGLMTSGSVRGGKCSEERESVQITALLLVWVVWK